MEYSVPSCALNLNFVIASSLSFLSMIDKNDRLEIYNLSSI